jgi:chromosome segregation and condensation protein ScpB
MNQLKTKIGEVKAKLGISTMQLSERLGKNPYYLYKVMSSVSTERQKELMLELEFVASGGQMHTGAGIAEMLENEREVSQSLRVILSKANDANKKSLDLLKLAESQYQQLDESYNRACNQMVEMGKRTASLQKYKRKYHNLVVAVVVTVIIVILGLVMWSVA